MIVCFFFSSRRRHTRFDCDWSSDVCSSDLPNTLELQSSGPLVRELEVEYVLSWPDPFDCRKCTILQPNYCLFVASMCMPISRSEEHTSELQSQSNLVCRLLLEKKKNEDD